jgi:hypothetical protein
MINMSSKKTQDEVKRQSKNLDKYLKYADAGEILRDWDRQQKPNTAPENILYRHNIREGQKRGTFRASYLSRPESERMEMLRHDYIRSLANDDKHFGKSSNVKVHYDVNDRTMAQYEQHLSELELMDFDQFLIDSFKPDNPLTNKILKKQLPGYYTRRQEQLQKVREYQNKLADIRMFGPRNEDDLLFMYFYDKKKIPDDKHEPYRYSIAHLPRITDEKFFKERNQTMKNEIKNQYLHQAGYPIDTRDMDQKHTPWTRHIPPKKVKEDEGEEGEEPPVGQ